MSYILRSDRILQKVFDVGDGKAVEGVEVVDGVADMSLMGGLWQLARLVRQGIRC